jgi:hypothetical protein
MLKEASFAGGIFFLTNVRMCKDLCIHLPLANLAGENVLIQNVMNFPFLIST